MNKKQFLIVQKPDRYLKSVRFFCFLFLMFHFPFSALYSQTIEQAKKAIEAGNFLEAFIYASQVKPTLSTESNLTETYTAFAEYLNIVEAFTNQIDDATGKQLFYQLEFESYESMINVCEQLFQKTGDEKYFEHAFNLAERHRNILLYNTLGFGEKHLSDSLKVIEGKFLSDITALNDQLKRQKTHFPEWKNGDYIYQLEQQRDYIQSQYVQFLKQQEVRKLNVVVIPNTHAVRQNIQNDEAFVIYFYGKKAIYTFVITGTNQSFFKIKTDKIPAEIDEMIFSIVENLHSAKETEAIFNLHELYKILFLPIDSKLGNRKKLHIVADGSLSVLPFDALLTEKPKNWDFNFKKLSYLVYDYQITFQHSAAIFIQQLSTNSNLKNPKLCVFAPNFKNIKVDNRQLKELKQSKFLVNDLVAKWQGSFYENEKATLKAFKNSRTTTILHFATHTFVDDESVLESKIVLADQPLFLKDLYQINLNADLAVLGSCRTGSGKYQIGVGNIGIAYGFQLAGVKSLVYSLWEVDETATNRLLLAFYDNLTQELDKAAALHQAKINYLQQANEITADPYYWAGFVLKGDTNAFEYPFSSRWIWWLVGIGFFLILFLIWKII